MARIHSDSLIHIDERKLNYEKTIIYRVRFDLNGDKLKAIINAKENNCNICFSDKTITKLRYYALVEYKYKRSPLIFITKYQNTKADYTIKTSILRDGKIYQEIEKIIIVDSQLFSYIISTHHWLISQILVSLKLKSTSYSKYLLPAIFFLVIVFVLLLILFLPITNSFDIILTVFGAVLLLAIANFIYKHKLSAWILYQLAEGFFAQGLLTKKIGIELLNIINNNEQ
ncbi:hypothetical protein [Myxosarcina sp. GI1]|uniref:hypothetical protein n=1 Tax=Myxosarcina sp. GI1 TaxID=1541065 RepID=UPI00055E464F|nr:hypothetical protein [Myxosarcina sp. GI1]